MNTHEERNKESTNDLNSYIRIVYFSIKYGKQGSFLFILLNPFTHADML